MWFNLSKILFCCRRLFIDREIQEMLQRGCIKDSFCVWFAAKKSPFLIEIQTIFNPESLLSNLRSMIRFINLFILLSEFLNRLKNSKSLISLALYVVSIIKLNVLHNHTFYKRWKIIMTWETRDRLHMSVFILFYWDV